MTGRDPYVPDGKDHTCKQCSRTFESYGKLRDHIIKTHESIPAEAR